MSADLQSGQCSWGAAAQPLNTTTAPHSQRSRSLPTNRHIPLCQGQTRCQERAQSPPHGSVPLRSLFWWGGCHRPIACPCPRKRVPRTCVGILGHHEVPSEGSWLVMVCFIRARGCSAQKGANKDSYSSPLIIWDPTFNICKYIRVPVLPSPLSWRNS